jgi:hypothetical protein
MAEPIDDSVGTRDLEKGMRASPASVFRTVAINAVLLLLLLNSAGLVRWTQALPSNALNVWLAERAADWDRWMHVSPAEILPAIRKLLGASGP